MGRGAGRGEGKERIYVVEPTGDFEDDPNVTDIDYMPPVPMGLFSYCGIWRIYETKGSIKCLDEIS